MWRMFIAFFVFCAVIISNCYAGENILKNPEFNKIKPDGTAENWTRRTYNSGTMKVQEEDGVKYLSTGVEKSGESSFAQQNIKLPEGTAKITLKAKSRWKDIKLGKQSWQKGAVHGRFTKNGKEIGKWLDLTGANGTSKDWPKWQEFEKTFDVPEGADGLLIRIGMYAVESGRLDTQYFYCIPVTKKEVTHLEINPASFLKLPSGGECRIMAFPGVHMKFHIIYDKIS